MLYMTLRSQYRLEELVAEYNALAPEQDIAEVQELFLQSERAHTRFRKAHPERTPAQRCYRCTGYVRSPSEEGRRLDEAERLREVGASSNRLIEALLAYQEANWIRCQH